MKARLALALACFAASPAAALTVDEMKQPGSAVLWRETDGDMRVMDIQDYMSAAHVEPTEVQVKMAELCVQKKLKPYMQVQVGDKKSPSLWSMLESCSK